MSRFNRHPFGIHHSCNRNWPIDRDYFYSQPNQCKNHYRFRRFLYLEPGQPSSLLGYKKGANVLIQRGSRRAAGFGFTLIELMVTLTLFALLLMLAVPSFTEWVRNNQIRATAESLQNGLRAAKGRATNLNRQVVFVTTNASPGPDALGAADGLNWYVQYVPRTAGGVLGAGENSTSSTDFYLEGGNFASGANGITVTNGPASICFNSVGRMVANATPSTSANVPACVVAGDVAFEIFRTGGVAGKDRKLNVTVSTAGQVRICDPARPAGKPDAC